MSGKGSTRRPSVVDASTFEERWKRAFAKGPAVVTCPHCGVEYDGSDDACPVCERTTPST